MFLTLLLLLSVPAQAADPLRAWQGNWEGPCKFAKPIPGESSVSMRLEVGAPDARGARAWRIIYIRPGGREEVRDYRLLATPSASRFTLDERNGILISVYRLGGALLSEFEVGDVRIATFEELQPDGTLRVRMTTSRPGRFEDSGGGATPAVRSYAVEQVQDCLLK